MQPPLLKDWEVKLKFDFYIYTLNLNIPKPIKAKYPF